MLPAPFPPFVQWNVCDYCSYWSLVSTNPQNTWYPNVLWLLVKERTSGSKQGYPGNRRLSCDLERKGKRKKRRIRKTLSVTWTDAEDKNGFDSLMMTNCSSNTHKTSVIWHACSMTETTGREGGIITSSVLSLLVDRVATHIFTFTWLFIITLNPLSKVLA